MSDLKKLLGKKIQTIRKSKGFTQEKLAELINMETGKYSPSVETLQKLSEALQVAPWEFYYFTDISDEDMKNELKQALEDQPKLVKLLYNFYKSIEY